MNSELKCHECEKVMAYGYDEDIELFKDSAVHASVWDEELTHLCYVHYVLDKINWETESGRIDVKNIDGKTPGKNPGLGEGK
jgi:hypothetical protein